MGMIVEEKHLTNNEKKKFRVVCSNYPPLVLHIVKEGMRIDYLDDFFNTKDTRVCYRHLNVARTPKMVKGLHEFLTEFSDVPYEKNLIEMIKSAYDGIGGTNKKENLSSLFCSEMMAKIYQKMGLLRSSDKGGLVCNEYAPRDFTSNVELNLLLDATLEDEVMLFSNKDF